MNEGAAPQDTGEHWVDFPYTASYYKYAALRFHPCFILIRSKSIELICSSQFDASLLVDLMIDWLPVGAPTSDVLKNDASCSYAFFVKKITHNQLNERQKEIVVRLSKSILAGVHRLGPADSNHCSGRALLVLFTLPCEGWATGCLAIGEAL